MNLADDWNNLSKHSFDISQDLLEDNTKEFLNSQEPLGEEFEKVLYDNLEDLYIKE